MPWLKVEREFKTPRIQISPRPPFNKFINKATSSNSMVLLKSGNKLNLGDKAPSFNLPSTDGKNYSLEDFQGKPLLVIFMCNHCPYVIAKLDYLIELARDYKERINIVGINSNNPEDYPEDSFENMKKLAEEKSFTFTYLFDETQSVAKEYGATCTPDPFLFNDNGKLVYHSRINNQMEPSDKVTEHDMKKAFDLVLEKKEIDFEVFPSIGCSIKWK